MSLPKPDRIKAVIDGCKEKHCDSYARSFREQANSGPEFNWKLLQQVFDLHFRPSDVSEPFGSLVVMDGKRSLIPTDLSDEDLDELTATLTTVDDPEYQARISDVIWLRRRDYKVARSAVDFYLASGATLEDPEHWVLCMENYERGLRLAKQLDPNGTLAEGILSHLADRVAHYNGTDTSYFSLKAIELLVEFKYGDFQKLSEIVNRVALEARKDSNFNRARFFYNVAAKVKKLASDEDGAELAFVALAETFAEEAEAREARGSFMTAHLSWNDAIQTFRHRPSLKDRVPELQRRYAAAGEKMLDEMKAIEGEAIDISEEVAKSGAAVEGQTWEDALCILASSIPLIDPAELRKLIEKNMSSLVFASFSSTTVCDASGRKIAVLPAMGTGDPAAEEKAVQGHMEQHAAIHRSLVVQAHILPMIWQIVKEHDVFADSFADVLSDSSFIPAGRHQWFYDAFAAGFADEMSISLHILIPQIEQALRNLLEQHGVTPRNVDDEGIEDVWLLGKILGHQKTTEILGDQIVFELKSLLTAPLGSNLRNLLSHGLLPPDAFSTPASWYFWWLALRLTIWPTACFRKYLDRIEREDGSSEGSEDGE